VKENVTAFDEVHERLIHLFVVRDDLGTFSHEHPALDADGLFRLQFTFPTGGIYRVFADVAPKGAGSQVLMATVSVSGTPGERFELAAARRALSGQAAEAQVSWRLASEKLPAHKTEALRVDLMQPSGAPVVDLQPWLGAMRHLLVVHSDGTTFAHAHPDEASAGIVQNGQLSFGVHLPKPGLYRAWLQFQRAGQIKTVDFVLEGY
jgi:hypothetical protein